MSNTRYKYTDTELATIVQESKSWAEVCRKIGAKPATGSQTYIKSRAVKAGIDFSHFTGRAWNKGTRQPSKRELNYYLVLDGPFVRSNYLKERLIKDGVKVHRCEECGLTEWQGKPIPIELDHINGVHNDNRLNNLRILCPNCHAQTPTYCAKNRLKPLGGMQTRNV